MTTPINSWVGTSHDLRWPHARLNVASTIGAHSSLTEKGIDAMTYKHLKKLLDRLSFVSFQVTNIGLVINCELYEVSFYDKLLRGCPAVSDVRPAECTPYPETLRNALHGASSKSGQTQHIQKSVTFP